MLTLELFCVSTDLCDIIMATSKYSHCYGAGRLVHGVGTGGTKKHPAYTAWKAMLNRCYGKSKRCYDSSTVCREWMHFPVFADWWDSWPVVIKYPSVDKDLLTGEKVYCPDNCCLIPQTLNSALTRLQGSKGWHINSRGKLIVQCRVAGEKRSEYADSIEAAELTYRKWKRESLLWHAEQHRSELTDTVYNRVVEIAEGL